MSINRPRIGPFAIVGAVGFVVQLTTLGLLTAWGWPVPAATAVAVELAVLHNFWWHERWTWRDRRDGSRLSRVVRFHAATGAVSLFTNVVVTWWLARTLGLPAIAANAVAVAIASAANFFAADRWVFGRHVPTATVLVLVLTGTASAAPHPEADAGWRRYLQMVEPEIVARPSRCDPNEDPAGEAVDVPSGRIYRWTGCTIVRDMTVDTLVARLLAAGTPPPQPDVTEARLLARGPDMVRVYLKVIRRTVITVAYDTEHEVRFERISPHLARSHSVATRIEEVGGGDQGFLWRLQSYWTYAQVGPDVHVSLVSLSLSRDLPLLLRPLASPIVNRVARESLARTLNALQAFGAAAGDDDVKRPAP